MLRTSQLPKIRQNGAPQKFEALADYVLIEVLETNETAGGIVLPEGHEPDMPMGRVVSVGPGMHTNTGELIPVALKEGDTVFLAFNGGCGRVMHNGKKHVVVREPQICGKVPNA